MAFKGFGATNTGSGGGFSFGASSSTAATTTTQSSTGFSFGAPATASTGLGFGAKPTVPALSLGANQSKPAATGFSLGGSATTKPTLGFGQTATTASTASALTLGTTQPQTSKPAFKGLGGVDLTSTASTSNGNGNKNNGISQAVKDQGVPAEICKDVKAFESYVQKQKSESNEVGKFSVRSLQKINEEINSLSVAVGTISSAVQRNKAAVESIRNEFTNQLKNMEIAHRTQDTPAALQHENIAPIKFFIDLVSEFSISMQSYRHQMEELENHLHSLAQPSGMNPQDLSMALCKMQESFITLASNLHSIHDSVKHIKEQYLAYRKVVHGDHTDIFKQNNPVPAKNKKIEGPSAFSNLSNVAALAMASMLQQPQQQQQQQAPPQQGFLGQNKTSNTLFGGTASGSLFGSKPTATTSSLFGSKPTLSTTGFGGFGSTNTLKPALSAGLATSTSGNMFFGGSTTFSSSAGLLNSSTGKRNKK
ncbi:nucleoporin p58/p45 [Ciona intestinalis]